MSSQYTVQLPGGVPSTHREHTESKTTILLPNDNTAFLNPPQQFNRDLSVAVIRAWNERRIEEGEARWKIKQERKAKKDAKKAAEAAPAESSTEVKESETVAAAGIEEAETRPHTREVR